MTLNYHVFETNTGPECRSTTSPTGRLPDEPSQAYAWF